MGDRSQAECVRDHILQMAETGPPGGEAAADPERNRGDRHGTHEAVSNQRERRMRYGT